MPDASKKCQPKAQVQPAKRTINDGNLWEMLQKQWRMSFLGKENWIRRWIFIPWRGTTGLQDPPAGLRALAGPNPTTGLLTRPKPPAVLLCYCPVLLPCPVAWPEVLKPESSSTQLAHVVLICRPFQRWQRGRKKLGHILSLQPNLWPSFFFLLCRDAKLKVTSVIEIRIKFFLIQSMECYLGL